MILIFTYLTYYYTNTQCQFASPCKLQKFDSIMEPPKITEIFLNSVSKQLTKRRIDDYDEHHMFEPIAHEYPMHKIQKLDESELQEALTNVQSGINYGIDNSYPLKEIDFDLESFLGEISTIPTTLSTKPAVCAELATQIKNDKTLAELIHMCNEPIKTISVKEEKMVEKEIQEIKTALKAISKSSYVYMFRPCEKSEAILIERLKMLFNTLVFIRYDFSKSVFNPESEIVLYEQLYKVNVHIRKNATREFKIYFGFPFYLSISIDIQGKIFIARNNIYKKLEMREEIEKIHYYSSNTSFGTLDVITSAKFINLITSKYFASGFDLVSKLIHIMDVYKLNSKKLEFNKLKINFEIFVKLYKKAINIVSEIPIRDL